MIYIKTLYIFLPYRELLYRSNMYSWCSYADYSILNFSGLALKEKKRMKSNDKFFLGLRRFCFLIKTLRYVCMCVFHDLCRPRVYISVSLNGFGESILRKCNRKLKWDSDVLVLATKFHNSGQLFWNRRTCA